MKDKTMPADPQLNDALRIEALCVEEDCIYSAKRHFNACSSWTVGHYVLGIPATVLAALVTTALVKNHADWAQALGMTSALFAALLTFLKPNDRASQHRMLGNQYLALRNEARMFRQIELIEVVEDVKKSEHIRRLAQRRNELNGSAPTTPPWAFSRARQGIEQGEADYKADKPALET